MTPPFPESEEPHFFFIKKQIFMIIFISTKSEVLTLGGHGETVPGDIWLSAWKLPIFPLQGLMAQG